MSNQTISEDTDDNDVMITEVTSAPRPSSKPTVTVQNRKPPSRPPYALNVMTKMGLNTAVNPRIMHALKLMQTTRMKRGPKEKATFQRYMYCLPEKTAKLPRFSSSDDSERAIVKQLQDLGYGYPKNDYNNGIPLRTHIDISLTEEGFDAFIKTTYPNLKNRYYSIYKIDKQRRLIKLETLTPRAIKDMKYQGSLIIIPYDDPNDKLPETMYRCVIDSCASEYSHLMVSPEMTNNYAMEYSQLEVGPSTSDETSKLSSGDSTVSASGHTGNQRATDTVTSTVTRSGQREVYQKTAPASFEEQKQEKEPIIIKIELDDSDSEMETAVSSSKIPHDQHSAAPEHKEADTSQSTTLKELSGIFERTGYLRSQLKSNVFYIHIDVNNLVNSFLQVYRQYVNILEHTVVVCCINHDQQENERHQQNPIQPYLVRFWDTIFETCFEGHMEKIPVCTPDIPEDLYLILGRVMYHGLVLHNYWPVKLSQACSSVIMTGSASDKQLAESFQKVLSDEQKAVVLAAKSEIRAGVTDFALPTQVNLCKTLRPYGNTTKPEPTTFNETLIKLSKFCMVQRPYWCLSQIRRGLQTVHGDLFQDIEEKDVFMFYSEITPSALPLFDKIVYLFSTCEEDPELEIEEKRVKSYLENLIMSFHSTKLSKLLCRWCHSDCLNNSHLYVRFAKSSICQRPIFDADHVTMTLSSVYTSQEEFSLIMSQEL